MIQRPNGGIYFERGELIGGHTVDSIPMNFVCSCGERLIHKFEGSGDLIVCSSDLTHNTILLETQYTQDKAKREASQRLVAVQLAEEIVEKFPELKPIVKAVKKSQRDALWGK